MTSTLPEAHAGPRYALYFAPEPGSALHQFGSRWLGRDAETDAQLEQPEVAGILPARLAEITHSPRRYGFHATLKAPFRLARGTDEATLIDAASRLAAGLSSFTVPALQLAEINGWRALVLSAPSLSMQGLCNALVAGLDQFRAPPTRQDIARRIGNGRLTEQQRMLFDQWGYPYVFDEFAFHMTLTEPVDAAEGRRVDTALTDLADAVTGVPLAVASVALFRQDDQESPFVVLKRFALMAIDRPQDSPQGSPQTSAAPPQAG